MNKQDEKQYKPDIQQGRKLINLRHKTIWIGAVAGLIITAVFLAATAVRAQLAAAQLAGGETMDVLCDGRGIQIKRISRREIKLTCQPDRTTNPVPTPPPIEPTATPIQEPTPQPTPLPDGAIAPYPNAPSCEDLGLPHDKQTWHGIWDESYGCHWNHEHHDNPHDGDALFGTEIYEWAGGELSYPWQTFAGADSLYTLNAGNDDPTTWSWPAPPTDPAKFENGGKHNVYFWRVDLGEDGCSSGDYELSENCLESFRVQGHASGNHTGAVTTFHSMYIQGLAQTENNACDNSQGAYLPDGSLNPNACFGSVGGWIDFGRLVMQGIEQNNQASRFYLPGDNPVYDTIPTQSRPYRLHPCVGSACAPGEIVPMELHSWNSSGNFHVPDFGAGPRLTYGYGFFVDDGWGPFDADAADIKGANGMNVLTCGTDNENCEYNSSRMGVFRAYIGVPSELDGTAYDLDGQVNGFATMRGFTTRYGDIVTYTAADGSTIGSCSEPGLDCVPFVFSNFPVEEAGYRGNIVKKTPEPGFRMSDMTEYDIFFCDGEVCPSRIDGGRKNLDAVPSGWIKFPN